MMFGSRVPAIGVLLFVATSWVGQAALADDEPWADFRFLIGSWVSDGKPEQGSGGFSFEPELKGKILVRRNHADLPAANGRPAASHDDLMVVYLMPGGKHAKASYYDSEGHVIQYDVSTLPDKKGLVFLSDPDPAAPRFRLTYSVVESGNIDIKFEIAPPGKPDEFKPYLGGTARRKKP